VAVLDASALIVLLNDEPGATTVRSALGDQSRLSAISAINLAESVDVLVRVYGIEESAVADAIDLLEIGGLDVVAVDARAAWQAGRLRARTYRKRVAEVSQADCVAIVTASARADPLITSYKPLAAVARAQGLDVTVLPDRYRSA
jgi:uncharacterized protein with PIN domain